MKKTGFRRLSKAFSTSHPSYTTIFRWFWEFKHVKSDFKDDGWSGRLLTASSNENVENLKVILKDNPDITH